MTQPDAVTTARCTGECGGSHSRHYDYDTADGIDRVCISCGERTAISAEQYRGEAVWC